jgi:hypothetical protein
VFKINKKTTAVSAAALAIVGGGSAFAYFYSDTGTGSTGTGGSTFLTVDDPSGGSGTITPHGDGRTFTVHILNSDTTSGQHPSDFNVSIIKSDGSPWSWAGSVTGQPACTAEDFYFADFTPGGDPTSWTVPAATTDPGTGDITPGSLTVTFKVRFAENNWNQVNCLGIPTGQVPVVVTVS